MGKDNRGRELGRGIVQRKDGLYLARFVDRFGKRKEKCSAQKQISFFALRGLRFSLLY